jgi:PAS domain S-box-containing protein
LPRSLTLLSVAAMLGIVAASGCLLDRVWIQVERDEGAVSAAVLWQSWWPQAIWIVAFSGILLAMMLRFHFALADELVRWRQAEDKSDYHIEQYRLLAEHSSDVIMRVGFDRRCRYVSPAMEQMLGWTAEELVGRDTRSMVHAEDKARLHDAAMSLTETSRSVRGEFRYLHKNGRYLWVDISMKRVNRGGVLDSYVANLRDISARVEAERRLAEASTELARLAATDQLTGLANRQRFDEEIEREWGRAARDKTPLSLLLFDVDFFKLYNDSYGRKAGDAVLKAVVGATVAALQRSSDLASRWGGEKFGLLLPNTDLRKRPASAV